MHISGVLGKLPVFRHERCVMTKRSDPLRRLLTTVALGLPSCLVVTLTATSAQAWGHHGHAVICEMAYMQLSDATRAEVDRLMAVHPDDKNLSTACAWADRQPRKKPRQHYVNFPRDQVDIDSQSCGRADKCIFTALRDDAYAMADEGRSDEERAEAMILLGHWIGDLHQPMHVGFADDRGGNSVHVKRGPKQGRSDKPCRVGSYNLHSVWDTCVVETYAPRKIRGGLDRLGGEAGQLDITAHAKQIMTRYTDEQRQAWADTEVTDWAQESLDIARDAPVQYCTMRPGTSFCAYSKTQDLYIRRDSERYDGARSVRITHGYVEFATQIAEQRLARASARYAEALHQAFQKSNRISLIE